MIYKYLKNPARILEGILLFVNIFGFIGLYYALYEASGYRKKSFESRRSGRRTHCISV